MKKYFLMTILTLAGTAFGSAPVTPLPRQVEGSLSYYVADSAKEIWLELPYFVRGSLAEVPGEGYSLQATIQNNTSLNRSEVQKIKSKYPNYKLREAVVTRKLNFKVDFGMSFDLEQSEDPSGRGSFFSVVGLLTKEQGDKLKAQIKAGRLPVFNISVERVIPGERVLESVTIPTRSICEGLVGNTRGRPVKISRAFSLLLNSLGEVLSKFKTRDGKQAAIEKVVDQCVDGVESGEKVSQIQLVFTNRANTSDLIRVSTIDESVHARDVVIEQDWSMQ